LGDDGTWERWSESVASAFDWPFHIVYWLGGEGWNE
jgi:hypothetical protein